MSWKTLGVAIAAAALGLSGCGSRYYRASCLPPELLAPPIVNPASVNLAGLAADCAASDTIQPGDVLDLSMVSDFTKLTTATTPLRVAEDGAIVVPLVGPVVVAGLPLDEAERRVCRESIARGVFRTPCITLAMKERQMTKVTVVGAVNKPGTQELPRGSRSMLLALVAAGGLTPEASLDVEIRRTAPPAAHSLVGNPALGAEPGVRQAAALERLPDTGLELTSINLVDAAGGKARIPELHDDDVVYVKPRTPKSIYVQGLVRKPGEFPYPVTQELRLLDAVALAGGLSNPVADKVLIIRQTPGEGAEPALVTASIQNAKRGRDNIALAPGDAIAIEQTPATAMVDVVQTFFRIGFSATFPGF